MKQNLQADFEKKRLSVQELKRQKEEAQTQLDELDKEVMLVLILCHLTTVQHTVSLLTAVFSFDHVSRNAS